ncbi:hypothetical protein [Pseudonocardia dioxanivorans]|uniref:hypothetical protein n=1 Tax=Pseudonocardia dioxanivorans TaxID=240495 RepID=UPI0018F87E1D|nr:hypothetical protein [Pseudonocardia dioxanivorans]
MARHRSPEGRPARPELEAALAAARQRSGGATRPRHALTPETLARVTASGGPVAVADRPVTRSGAALIPAPRDSDDVAADTAVDIWAPEFWTPGVHTPPFGISTARETPDAIDAQDRDDDAPTSLFTAFDDRLDRDDDGDPADDTAWADRDSGPGVAGLGADGLRPTGLRRIPPRVRKVAAVVVAAGSALTLAGAVATLPQSPEDSAAALQLDDGAPGTTPAGTTTTGTTATGTTTGTTAQEPPPAFDTTAVVTAVQQAQQHADAVAATQRADAERKAAEAAAKAKAAADAEAAAEAKAAADRKAAETQAAAARAGCGLSTSGLGGVKPWVANAAEFLGCLFGKPTMLGVGGRGNASDHPGGLAVDFMVSKSVGDRLAACALRNKDALGITYVIWQQRINYGSGWKGMEDRGSATANHMDHVHVSFAKSAPGGTPVAC